MISNFPALLETFFTDWLMHQRKASGNTIASYRDAFRLLLRFAQKTLKKAASDLELEDLAAPFILRFLDHLENDRGNCARTRNQRLAAIRSFFAYAAVEEPGHSALIQRVLAIPAKRTDRREVEFLDPEETEALCDAPDLSQWTGRRDRALLSLAIDTGLRVSELIGLRCEDVVLGAGAHVRCEGKGRKERSTPLSKPVQKILHQWLTERHGRPEDPLFPSTRGGSLSRDAVEYLLAKHVAAASEKCPSMTKKRISPHVLRHSTAMNLLYHGVGRTVIALWLGHERAETTQVYTHANLKLKEKILERITPPNMRLGRYRPTDSLLLFLERL